MSLFDGFPRGVPGRDDRNALLGTAAWSATAPEWREGFLWLGRDAEGRAVGHGDDRHIVTIAGSRAGKGRSAIIPNLYLWPGSGLVLDPKGENATRTADKRAKRPNHRVAVVDPHGVADVPDELRASFNPLDMIDADSDDAIDLAAAIGDALMIASGDGKDVHWIESARQILEGVLLHVASKETAEHRSLVRVRQFLTLGDRDAAARLNAAIDDDTPSYSAFDALWHEMANNGAANDAVSDVIAGAANSITEMGDDERGSVLSTARRNTKFIDSRWMRRCLQGRGLQGAEQSALDLDMLKASPGGLTIYVCLPARFIPTHARFLRLVLSLAIYRMEAQGLEQPACGHPVLMVLDEFAAIGRLESIEKAAGLMAGFGVKLWPILQDLGQLKHHYKESWETFLGNAGILQFFGNSDMTTLEWLSKRMGQIELIRETAGRSDSTTTSVSKTQSQTDTSGWGRSTGSSTGQSDMPDLQRLAARDGGSGLVSFLARTGASGVGYSEGTSHQDSASGGQSVQSGDSSSSGSSASTTATEGIHRTPLMNPDEIALAFDRKTGRQIVIIDSAPVALWRTNYDSETAFYHFAGEEPGDA